MERRCGIGINLVIDRSNSVAGSVAATTAAAQAFVDDLEGTGTQIRLSSFASYGAGHPDGSESASFSLPSLAWSSVDGYTVPSLRNPTSPFGPAFPDQGSTNLEAGLEVIRRAPGPVGELTIIFSDGEPNAHNLTRPDGLPGPFVNLGDAKPEAIREANRLKAAGSHVLAVGVTGWGGITVDTLQAISGPDRVGDVPIEEADYVDLTSFSQVAPAIRDVASQLCASTLQVNKYITREGAEALPLCGITFAMSASPEPNWVSDLGKGGLTTCDNRGSGGQWGGGLLVAEWNPTAPSHTVTFTEQSHPNYEFQTAVCYRHDPELGQQQVPAVVDPETATVSVDVAGQDQVRCEVYNQAVATPGVDQLFLVTRTADGDVGPTLVRANVTGNAIATVAVPGGAVFNVGASPTLRFTPLDPQWRAQELVCDGVVQSSPDLATPQFTPGQDHLCVLTLGREQTLGYIELTAQYSSEAGSTYNASWQLQFPSGSSGTWSGPVRAWPFHSFPGTGNAPLSVRWGVEPGSPYTLSLADAPPELQLSTLACRLPNGQVISSVSGLTFEVVLGQTVKCGAVFEFPTVRVIINSNWGKVDGGPTNVNWAVARDGGSAAQKSGSIGGTALEWTGFTGDYELNLVSSGDAEFVEANCVVNGPNGHGGISALSEPWNVDLETGQTLLCDVEFAPGG